MKQFILFFVLLFSVTVFGQETTEATVELDPSFNGLTNFFLPAVLGALLTLFADAAKHLKAGTWDTGIFLKTKAVPFALSVVLGVVVYYIMIYAPYLKSILEILAGTGLSEITAAAFLGFAAALIDGFMKKEPAVTTNTY